MTQNEAQCSLTTTPSWNASGIPKVSYAPAVCKQLFAFRHTRDLCLRLQPEVCGKDCASWGENGTEDCKGLQESICELPQYNPQHEPLSVGAVPEGKKKSVATVCIAVSNWGPNELWLARDEGNKS